MTRSGRGMAARRAVLSGLVLTLFIMGGPRGVRAGTNYWTTGGPAGRQARAIAVDPAAPDTLYAGTDEGVFKSVDAGASWEPTGLTGEFLRIDALLAVPGPPTVLFASGDFAVQKSEDGGETWVDADDGFGSRYVQALAADPGDPRTLYAGTYRPSGTLPSGVFKTTDAGLMWSATEISNSPIVSAVAVDPVDTSVVYAVDHFDVTRSDDGGATWSAVERFRFHTAGPLVAVGNTGQSTVYVEVEGTIYRSTDFGRTWTGGNGGLVGAVTSLAADPVVNTTVYAGTSEGVFKSTDGGASWASLQIGLLGERIDDLVVDPDDRSIVYAATSAGVYSLTQEGFFACGGDCNGDDRITVDELVSGVRIAIGAAPVSGCPSFDIDRNGEVSIDELVGAVGGALGSCLPVSRVRDFAGFEHFELGRRSGLGFCPPLGLFSATITREAFDRYELEYDVLEEGVMGVDDCLIDFVGEVDCAVVRPRPPRQLDLQGISPLLTAFETVLVHEGPDRICRDVIFDPCLINVLSWDSSPVNDFICGGRRIDEVESSRILGLLEDLSQAAE